MQICHLSSIFLILTTLNEFNTWVLIFTCEMVIGYLNHEMGRHRARSEEKKKVSPLSKVVSVVEPTTLRQTVDKQV